MHFNVSQKKNTMHLNIYIYIYIKYINIYVQDYKLVHINRQFR